jgi:cyclomaltodextrinase
VISTAVPPTGTWWHVYALGFLGAPPQALPPEAPIEHRLPRLENWLDYCVELGVEGLVLGPVFASQTHGYDTVDHYRVDSRLGTEADLDHLVAAAHDHGLRVVLDGVFNHVGRSFAPFADLVAHGPSSRYASWFAARWPEGWSPGDGAPDVDVFEGHQPLVILNHDAPGVADHVAGVMRHWCDRGVDGWRLDAAYAVKTSFWREVIGRLRESHPRAWVFGELIHGDYSTFVAESGADSATQYELWKAIASSLNDGNFWELRHAIGRHQGLLATFAPVTFLGNHDTTRIASRLADIRHLPHALAVLFGVGGTPVVYSGDEQAFRGVKYDREGGDDEVRPAFPERPDELSRLGQPVLELHRRLIRLRSERPWLTTARTAVAELSNESVLLVSRPGGAGPDGEPAPGDDTRAENGAQADHGPGPRVAVALNVSDVMIELPVPPGRWTVSAGESVLKDGRTALAGQGWAVLTRD